MNGFADHGLSDEDFGSSKGGLKSFDAFPKTKPTYQTRTANGGAWTLVILLTCAYLTISETLRWHAGSTTHAFSVEKGVSHDMQINIDVVVAMRCADLHVNVQDASGDRILAGEKLRKDDTAWRQWGQGARVHRLGEEKEARYGRADEDDVHDYLGAARRRRKFAKTPRLRGHADACRIYGSLEGNKVQGDFHITARGHGYMEFGEHLDHSAFNFTHQINELSFGPFYPSLTNPLDNTLAITPSHFYKYQYYLSVVPTTYTTDPSALSTPQNPLLPSSSSRKTIHTNQYAATSQSHLVGENQVPGIFVKYDIEPIALTVAEARSGALALLVRLVNVVSGVLVAGSWVVGLSEWWGEVLGRRRGRRAKSEGVITGRRSGEFDGGEKKGF